MRTILLLIVLVTCGCVAQIDRMRRAHPKVGDEHLYVLIGWGGQHVAESSGGTRYSGNLENSFQVAAQALLSYGMSLEATKVALAQEVTKRYEMGQLTIQKRDALFAAIEQASTEGQLEVSLAQIANSP